jgi:GTP pyrophosphokinase
MDVLPRRNREEGFPRPGPSAYPSGLPVEGAFEELQKVDYKTEGEALWSRFKDGKEGTLWYYRALVLTYRSAGSTSLVGELDRVVTEFETLRGNLARPSEG